MKTEKLTIYAAHHALKIAKQESDLSVRDIAEKSGYARQSIQSWLTGTSPTMNSFIDVMSTLGYEILIQKKERPKNNFKENFSEQEIERIKEMMKAGVL